MRRISLTFYGHVELKARGTVGHGFNEDMGSGVAWPDTAVVVNATYPCTKRRRQRGDRSTCVQPERVNESSTGAATAAYSATKAPRDATARQS